MPALRATSWLLAAVVASVAYAAPTTPVAPDPVAAPPYRAPYIPAKDSELLQQVPAAADPEVRQMRALRKAFDADPTSLPAADLLARAYIDFGRELGDAHYAGYAEAVLGPWLRKPVHPVLALVDYATILQYRHQFDAARGQLKLALSTQATNAQAWLTLATLDMVQGDYSTATHDCSQVGATGGLQLSIACVGNLRSYLGQAQQSLILLKQLAGGSKGSDPTLQSWIQGLLAETCERLGDWAEAESHYRQALQLTPKDNFLLVAYADLLLDRNRAAEVLPLLRDSTQSDTAFLRIALAKAALKSPDVALYSWIMGARFEALRQRGSDYFGREQVRYALYLQQDPQGALDLAQQNWRVQRAPWDARVFLEAAAAAKQPEAATAVLKFLRETKLQDPIIEPLARQLEAQLAASQRSAP